MIPCRSDVLFHLLTFLHFSFLSCGVGKRVGHLVQFCSISFWAFTFELRLWQKIYMVAYTFRATKTVSVMPKSCCISIGEFQVLGEVKVKCRLQGKQQTYLGIILRACPKRE